MNLKGNASLTIATHGTVMQRQTAVTAYLKSKQLLLFAFGRPTIAILSGAMID